MKPSMYFKIADFSLSSSFMVWYDWYLTSLWWSCWSIGIVTVKVDSIMCVVIVYDAMKSHSTALSMGEGCFATLSASWSELLISHCNLYWAVVYVTTQPRISERLNPTNVSTWDLLVLLLHSSCISLCTIPMELHYMHVAHGPCPPFPPGWWDRCCYNLLILHVVYGLNCYHFTKFH